MIHGIPAMRKQMPREGGPNIRFRRYNPLQTAMVPLGNSGIQPPAQNLTAVDIDAKMAFHGTYIILNEQVTLQAQDPVLNEAAKRLGVAMRQTEDQLIRDVLSSTASFINCTGGVNGDNPTEITRSDVGTVVRALLDADTKTIVEGMEGEDKFGTSPIRDAYFALCSTHLTSDLDNIQGFVNKSQYPSNMRALESELTN